MDFKKFRQASQRDYFYLDSSRVENINHYSTNAFLYGSIIGCSQGLGYLLSGDLI